MATVITSAANPAVKRMRLLADRKHRRREAAFVVEGIQPVWQAVEAGAEIEAVVLAPGLLGRSAAREMVADLERAGTRVTRVSDELFRRLSGRDGPSGLAAIVRTAQAPLTALRIDPDSVFVALHEIANPGNLGTIIRTANAAGAAGVVLIGMTTDPYDPAAVKASMGALFSTPVCGAGTEEFFSWAARAGVSVVTTSAGAADSFWEAPYPRPLAVLLGSEGPGLPDEIVARGDLAVRIPMVGTAESLNVAVAAGVLLYELRRRMGR